jgi:hypothetical protein
MVAKVTRRNGVAPVLECTLDSVMQGRGWGAAAHTSVNFMMLPLCTNVTLFLLFSKA